MLAGAVAVALLFLASGGSLAAQDVAVRGEVDGGVLPPAYLDDLAREPRLFTFPGPGWAHSRRAVSDAVEGTLPVVVIPALFSDSRNPHVSRDMLQRILFDGPTPGGTLTEYYREVSHGRLEVTGEVVPWVRTRLTLEEATGGQAGFGEEARLVDYLLQALDEADRLVDFARFDNDGPDGVPGSGDDDGVVDAVAFEFLEVSGSCGGPGVWPHRSAISWRTGGDPYLTNDVSGTSPVIVDAYIIQSVTDCAGTGVQNANVISHEMGHVLGLPDIYHPVDSTEPEGRRWVIGCWGLMAAGSWGCGDASVRVEGFGPSRMAPWSLAQLGWVELEEVGADALYRPYRIEPTLLGGRPLRIPLDSEGRESLVLEYRIREGFDRVLPGQGIVAYLWNEDGVFRPQPGSGLPYRFRVLEGDGDTDLIRTHPEGGNRGEVTDLFGFPGNAPSMSAATTPATHRADGTATPVTVHRFAYEGGAAIVWISTAPTPAVIENTATPASAFSGWVQFHRVAGGIPPYDLSVENAPEWMSLGVTGDRLDLSGTPDGAGDVTVAVELTDAAGTPATWSQVIPVGPFAVPGRRIAAAILQEGSGSVTPLEAQLLDEAGNGNGRLDIGDLRAHLRQP